MPKCPLVQLSTAILMRVKKARGYVFFLISWGQNVEISVDLYVKKVELHANRPQPWVFRPLRKKVRIRDLELLAESGYPDAQSKLKHDAIPTIFNLPPAKDVAENPIRRPWLSKSSRRGAFEKRKNTTDVQ